MKLNYRNVTFSLFALPPWTCMVSHEALIFGYLAQIRIYTKVKHKKRSLGHWSIFLNASICNNFHRLLQIWSQFTWNAHDDHIWFLFYVSTTCAVHYGTFLFYLPGPRRQFFIIATGTDSLKYLEESFLQWTLQIKL